MTETSDSGVATGMTTSASTGRGRRIGVFLLLILASVLLFGTAADIWVKRQVLSTPKWVAASDKILAKPEVQAALASYIVDVIYTNVDVQQELSDQLPEGWKGLAAPVAAGVRAPATGAVEKILGTPQVLAIWNMVNEKAHTTLVNVLEDKTRVGTTEDGKVTVNIGEIVTIVGTQLGLPSGVLDKIPADAGEITIFESSSLSTVQSAVKVVQILGPILSVVIIALYALAVWLARGRRRRTLRNVGWSVIVVGLLLTTLRRATSNQVGSNLVNAEYAVAAKLTFGVLSELLFDTAWVLISWGLLIVVGMVVIGPSRIATWARRVVAPLLNSDRTVFWIGAATLYLVVLLVVPSPALRLWWSVIAIGVVVGLGLEYLRRASLAEFPEMRLDLNVEGLRTSAESAWSGLASRFARNPPGDHVAQLQQLSELRTAGALSEEEYASAKSKLLD
ncbi:MAG: SHOCT domain-containing protein [Acidimicrobiales bacterium]